MLAVVEHQQGVGPGHPVEQSPLGRHLQRPRRHLEDRSRGVDLVEAHQPPLAGQLDGAGDLDGEAGLADPGGPDERHQALPADQFDDVGEVGRSPRQR